MRSSTLKYLREREARQLEEQHRAEVMAMFERIHRDALEHSAGCVHYLDDGKWHG